MHGIQKWFYEDEFYKNGNYNEGKFHGSKKYYYENGMLKKKELY